MTITLTSEQEELFQEALQSGRFHSPDEVIARALEVFRAEEGFLYQQAGAIDRKIQRALAQFERGEFFTAEQSRQELQRRKAAWRSQRP
ncbi:MAG: hypothetical protein NW208_01605 [Bryobacter sp.]|nr:hypothetical protein [Bryobacter sp.]